MVELNLRHEEINATKINEKMWCTETNIVKSNVSQWIQCSLHHDQSNRY